MSDPLEDVVAGGVGLLILCGLWFGKHFVDTVILGQPVPYGPNHLAWLPLLCGLLVDLVVLCYCIGKTIRVVVNRVRPWYQQLAPS